MFKIGERVKEKRHQHGPGRKQMTVVAVADKGHIWCEWEESGNVREHEFMPLELESVIPQSPPQP
jgi:uncharacterized protein YodC (DUF2158 family)